MQIGKQLKLYLWEISTLQQIVQQIGKTKKHTRKGLPLFKWLEKQDFKDTFRLLYLDDQEFTWSGRDIATRIDYIWVSANLAPGLIKAEIVDVEIYTDSDHKSVLAELQIDHMIANKSKALIKKNRQGRTIYLYD